MTAHLDDNQPTLGRRVSDWFLVNFAFLADMPYWALSACGHLAIIVVLMLIVVDAPPDPSVRHELTVSLRGPSRV
ncbi:MAG: hypothetical protein AAF517_04730, partial [Planctomycetota bacterium]